MPINWPSLKASEARGTTALSGGPRPRDDFLLLGAAVLVLLTRLPFLSAGYGLEPDAYRVANAARIIATTGRYVVSRFPGYPLHEAVCSLLWRGGPWALNGASALAGIAAFVLFALLLRKLSCKDWLLGAIALAMTPVVFSFSVTALDPLWALAFFLGSLHAILAGHPLLAGLLLGLAVGCRATTAAMIIPLSFLWLEQAQHERRWPGLALLACGSGLLGALCYLPVWLRYGWTAFSSPGLGQIVLRRVPKELTIGVWGVVGFLALSLSIISLLATRRVPPHSIAQPLSRPWRSAIAAGLSIPLAVYAFLPTEARYLIPALPFALILLARVLRRDIFISLCAALILSPWLLSLDKAGLHLAGPILREHQARVEIEGYIAETLACAKRLEPGSLVVCGPYLPRIESALAGTSIPGVTFVYLLDATSAAQQSHSGASLYYLRDQNEVNRQVHGMDLTDYGAKPLSERCSPTRQP